MLVEELGKTLDKASVDDLLDRHPRRLCGIGARDAREFEKQNFLNGLAKHLEN